MKWQTKKVFLFYSGLNLTQLTLPGRRCVTDSGLSSLSRLTLLTELDLTDYTQVTDQGVAQLASMRRSFPHFWSFHYDSCRRVDSSVVLAGWRSCRLATPRWRTLDLYLCRASRSCRISASTEQPSQVGVWLPSSRACPTCRLVTEWQLWDVDEVVKCRFRVRINQRTKYISSRIILFCRCWGWPAPRWETQ